MKRVKNKKFLYKKGTRLWYLYRYPTEDFYTCWGVNARAVSDWVPCSDYAGCTTGGIPCISGGLQASFGRDRQCVCRLNHSCIYRAYVTEGELREIAKMGKLRNNTVKRRRRWRGSLVRLPKIWREIEDLLV